MAQHSTQVLTSFKLFPTLPAEIRIKIWHATFFPRSIPYDCLYDGYATAPRAPLALSINQESRCEALPIYAPLFTDWNKETRLRAMIAPEIDTLTIPISTFPGAPHFGELAKQNRLVNKRIAHICTWGASLEYLTEQANWKIESMKRFTAEEGRFRGFPWQNPVLSFGRIEVWTVSVSSDVGLGRKEWEAPLLKFERWFLEVQNLVGEEVFRAPRCLRVVDQEGTCLASLPRKESIGDVKV